MWKDGLKAKAWPEKEMLKQQPTKSGMLGSSNEIMAKSISNLYGVLNSRTYILTSQERRHIKPADNGGGGVAAAGSVAENIAWRKSKAEYQKSQSGERRKAALAWHGGA